MDDAQIERFSRHILLAELGPGGQDALLAAHVSVPSLDAAGRSCALWLARAGVGTLDLPDDRTPAPSLDSSGLLHAADAGRPLAEAVEERLRFHAPHLRFAPHASRSAPSEGGPGAALAVVRAILQAPRT